MPVPAANPDPGGPSPAGVRQALLGGVDCFAADRAIADALCAVCPEAGRLAADSRAFGLKAARWCASMLGVSQFVDVGCGLPCGTAVHEAAAEGIKDPHVVYVDRDPLVVCAVKAAVRGIPGVAVAEGDAAGPAGVLAGEVVRGAVDLARPVCVILGAVLSSLDEDTAAGAVRGWAEALAPGSAVVVSCATFADLAVSAAVAETFAAAGEWRDHGEAVAGWFAGAGLRVVRGKVGSVRSWPLLCGSQDDTAAVVGGIGIRD